MTRNGSTASTRFDRDTVRSVSRVAIAALALVGVLSLFTMLPGMDRLVPLTPVTFAAVVTAVFTLAVVALLVYAAPRLASLTRVSIHRSDGEGGDGIDRVAEGVGSVVYWLVILAAILVAHAGLAGVISPFLDGVLWAYDAAFLVVSLVPLVFLVARLAVTIDPMSERIADRVAGEGSADNADPKQATGDGGSERAANEE